MAKIDSDQPEMPVEWRTSRLVGKVLNLQGVAVIGTLKLTPSPDVLLSTATNTLMVADSLTIPLDDKGAFDVRVLATDDPDIAPTGWTYHVEESWPPNREYDIAAPVGVTQNLGGVVLVEASAGVGGVEGGGGGPQTPDSPGPDKGEVGPRGIPGNNGNPGQMGPSGPRGEIGPVGPQGEMGVRGMTGGSFAYASWKESTPGTSTAFYPTRAVTVDAVTIQVPVASGANVKADLVLNDGASLFTNQTVPRLTAGSLVVIAPGSSTRIGPTDQIKLVTSSPGATSLPSGMLVTITMRDVS